MDEMEVFRKEQVLFRLEVHECLRRLTRGGLPRHKAVGLLLQRLRGSSLRNALHASGNAVPIAEVETLVRYMRLSREEAVRAVALAEEMRALRAQGLTSLEALRVLRRRIAALMNKGQTASQSLERKRALVASVGQSLEADSGSCTRVVRGSAHMKGEAGAGDALGSGAPVQRAEESPDRKRFKLGECMEVCPPLPDQKKRSRSVQTIEPSTPQSPMEISPKRPRHDA